MEKQSIANQVYATLKNRILNLEYKPGRSISVASLAQEMNVSRSPVREAFLKLSSENLIDIFPQSGSRVSLINLQKVEEERFIRKGLELAAVKEMYYCYTQKDLDLMSEYINNLEEATKLQDCIKNLYWDEMFHMQIFKSINKEACWRLAIDHSPNEHRVRLLALQAVIQTNEKVIQNHKDLVSALRTRNLQEALNIENIHLSRISQEVFKLVRAYPEIFQFSEENSDTITNPVKIRDIAQGTENFLHNLEKMV